MGTSMMEDDIYVPSFLEQLNLRFAPRMDESPDWFGGVEEIAQLQKDHQIFQEGRSFRQSVALLGLGKLMNWRATKRWLDYLDHLKRRPSNRPGQNGDERIVKALIEHLASDKPSPVHFKAHDARQKDGERVIVGEEARPVFYIEKDYLTISLPMRPPPPEARRR